MVEPLSHHRTLVTLLIILLAILVWSIAKILIPYRDPYEFFFQLGLLSLNHKSSPDFNSTELGWRCINRDFFVRNQGSPKVMIWGVFKYSMICDHLALSFKLWNQDIRKQKFGKSFDKPSQSNSDSKLRIPRALFDFSTTSANPLNSQFDPSISVLHLFCIALS
jgi:hypothetical protein